MSTYIQSGKTIFVKTGETYIERHSGAMDKYIILVAILGYNGGPFFIQLSHLYVSYSITNVPKKGSQVQYFNWWIHFSYAVYLHVDLYNITGKISDLYLR